jgi:hypothetical protein
MPVLLVNEQQSTQQAKAVRTGKAAYDIFTLSELRQQQEQQQQEQQQRLRLREQQTEGQPDRPQLLQAPQQLPQRQPQEQQQQLSQRQREQADPGRDAYAAALILARYYNGLVQPTLVKRR